MLKKKLQEEQLKALKNKQTLKLNLLRYILAKIKNEEINKKRELFDEEILIIIQKLLEENQESQRFAQKAKKESLLKQLEEEKNILNLFLPPKLTRDQLKEKIRQIINKNINLYKKNPKAIIGLCIKQLKINSHPNDILQILKEDYEIV